MKPAQQVLVMGFAGLCGTGMLPSHPVCPDPLCPFDDFANAIRFHKHTLHPKSPTTHPSSPTTPKTSGCRATTPNTGKVKEATELQG